MGVRERKKLRWTLRGRSGISAGLTRKLILFGVLKACTHTSLAFSYLVTSHELRRETLDANSQTRVSLVVHTSFSGITNHHLSKMSHATSKEVTFAFWPLKKKTRISNLMISVTVFSQCTWPFLMLSVSVGDPVKPLFAAVRFTALRQQRGDIGKETTAIIVRHFFLFFKFLF